MSEEVNQIKLRLKQYMAEKRLSVNSLSKILKIPQPTLHRQLSEEGALGADNLQAVLEQFPEISADWLILGKGDMLRTVKDPATDSKIVELLQQQLAEEKERSNKYWETIQKLIK